MIEVDSPIPEPKDFGTKCRQPGNTWLANNPDAARPKDLWSPFRPDLAAGFVDRCGYGGMWISSGTVDHFVSCDECDLLAYEWNNYRYIEGWINSSKKNKLSSDILDPFEVREGWFEIILPSLQLVATDAIPPAFKVRAANTLKHLPISHDERVLKTRRAWLAEYEQGRLTLEGLMVKAPLIAKAVLKRRNASLPGVQSTGLVALIENATNEAQILADNLFSSRENPANGPLSISKVWGVGLDQQVIDACILLNVGVQQDESFAIPIRLSQPFPLDIACRASGRAAEVLTQHFGPYFVPWDGRD